VKPIDGDCPECGPSAGSEWVITDPDGVVLYVTRNYEWALQYIEKLTAATQPGTGDQVHNRKESE